MTALLEVAGLESGYGDALVLRGVSLRAERDEIVSLIGPNGAGKSTLLKTIYGLVPARAGSIHLLGREITRLRADRLTHAGVNFVPQVDNVFPTLSVSENLKVSVLPVPRSERADALARVEALFPIVRERARQQAGTLSGGQRKLLDFARVLMTEPRLVLLDEPMAGVNPVLRGELLEHVVSLREEHGVTVLLVEHDLEVVMGVSDRVVVMSNGAVIASGPPDGVRSDARVVDAYLGVEE